MKLTSTNRGAGWRSFLAVQPSPSRSVYRECARSGRRGGTHAPFKHTPRDGWGIIVRQDLGGFWTAGVGRRALVVLSAVGFVAGCGSGDSGGDQVLRPAGDAVAEESASKAVRSEIGEPARLTNDLGQDVSIVVRSVELGEGPDGGRRLIADVRIDNDTDEDQSSPELELWCGDTKQPFYSEGTFEWGPMPAGTFLEGTRAFEFPDDCDSPELRAVPLAHSGESVRWDATPK